MKAKTIGVLLIMVGIGFFVDYLLSPLEITMHGRALQAFGLALAFLFTAVGIFVFGSVGKND